MIEKDRSVILIICAYDESANIESVLLRIGIEVDLVVVVDDGSNDSTSSLVEKYFVNNSRKFVLLRHDNNRGQGATRATGATFALTGTLRDESISVVASYLGDWKPSYRDILIFTDGDGQLDPKDVLKFLKCFEINKVDFVKGDRFGTPDLLQVMPKVRLFGNVFLSAVTKIASGYWDLTDSQCGYFAISSKSAAKLNWHKLRSGYGQINDLTIRLSELNTKASSVPIAAVYGVGEVSRLKIRKVAFPILFLCIKGFYRRIVLKHIIWKTHPMAAFYVFGNALILISTLLAIYVFKNITTGEPAPPLTSILTMTLGSLGMLAVFQGVALDLNENRRLYVEYIDDK